MSFLSTALPDGFEAGVTLVPGLVAGPDGTLVPGPVPVRGYGDRGWTGFEQGIGALIKKSEHAIDIGPFSAEEAARWGRCPPYASKRFADKTVKELQAQASYDRISGQGMLGSLVGGSRGPPLVPAAFDAEVLAQRTFTNGADHAVVASLYKATAEALLASTPTLEFTQLEWRAADFAQLGAALRLTRALETLSLDGMPLDDEGARALVPALPRTLKTPLNLSRGSFTVLPELPPLPLLQALDLSWCYSLAALLGLPELPSLQTLDLSSCSSLAALPELSALPSLRKLDLSCCSSLTAEAKEAARRQLPSGADLYTS